MKKTIVAATIAVIGFAVTTAFVAPKVASDSNFEGVITYSISVDNPQAASMMQGSSVKIYMKGDKVKMVMDMNVSKTTVITNRNTPDNPTILLDIMGNKYQLKNDDKKKDKPKDPQIKYVDGTKTVAGYNCKKAEIMTTSTDGEAYTTTVYYTEDLPAYSGGSGQFKGLKGFPLEYTVKQQGVNISMSATSVSKESVSDDTFTVPAGYKLMTSDEMKQDIQKQMSGGN